MASKNKKHKGPRGLKVTEDFAPTKVKMKFSEHKFYTDLNTPMFLAGKVYDVEGADWIQRWVKRGGEIVEGEFPVVEADEPNLSALTSDDKTPKNVENEPVAESGLAEDSDEESLDAEIEADSDKETDAE